MLRYSVSLNMKNQNWIPVLTGLIKVQGVISIQVTNWIQSQAFIDKETLLLKALNVKFKLRLIPPAARMIAINKSLMRHYL